MASGKTRVIAAGFAFFRATGLHRLVLPWTRGQGAILMFHHVRPWQGGAFAPNRLLEITPQFLDAVLTQVRALGFDIVTLDDALARLGSNGPRPFVALTFDDGYKDNRTHALPVLERHEAPFTMFVTNGFAERTARLWWIELEEAVRRLPAISAEVEGVAIDLPSETTAQKMVAFETLYGHLRAAPEATLLDVIARLGRAAGVDARDLVDRLCLDWPAIETLGRHPLATLGVHTLTHAMLAKHPVEVVRRELAESRRQLEARIGRPARHLAYPVGDPSVAGPREFALAAELGFASAVTTRPGMLFPDHKQHQTALPRVSVNGNWQRFDAIELLLSGAPFALWNRGRRLAVA